MINTKKHSKLYPQKIIAHILIAALILSKALPKANAINVTLNSNAFAEASAFGSNTQYGLDENKIAQKVYFGKNGTASQGWYIAGYQESGYGEGGDEAALVLLCDPNQPMVSSQVFLESTNYDSYTNINKTTYQDGEAYTEATQVYAHHYGASDIIKKLESLEADPNVFTQEEQNLIKTTKTYTYDPKNNKTYNIAGKLYLAAAGAENETYITVGANKVDTSKTGNASVNNGLKIGLTKATGPSGSPYTTGNTHFWLRSPYPGGIKVNTVLQAKTGNSVTFGLVDLPFECAPAFALDSSSVLFASIAEPNTNVVTVSDGMYLRFKDTNSRITTQATVSRDGINVTKGSESSVYLYIQGNNNGTDWAYSKNITTANETITIQDINTACNLNLESLKNCKAWLETTENNLTYAKTFDISEVELATPIYIALKDEFGNKVTNMSGITLALKDSSGTVVTSNSDWEKTGNIFRSKNLYSGNYQLVVTVNENNSNYMSPAGTFTITKINGISPSSATEPNKTVVLQQKIIDFNYVQTGMGGEASCKYNRRTKKKTFKITPNPGYKLDKIWEGADGKVSYVKFKIA